MGGETNRENWEHFYFSDASQAPVVQKLIASSIKLHAVDIGKTNIIALIQWIEVYRVDSAMHLFNNWGQISEIVIPDM